MKTKRVIWVAVLVSVSVTLGYWLGYQDGSSATARSLVAGTSPKQIGLHFRMDQNDVTRFTATGAVVAPTVTTAK